MARAAPPRPLPTTAPLRSTSSIDVRRFEVPWLALSLLLALSVIGYAFWRAPPAHFALPDAPDSSKYGASLLGQLPPTAPDPPPAVALPPLEPPAAAAAPDPEPLGPSAEGNPDNDEGTGRSKRGGKRLRRHLSE